MKLSEIGKLVETTWLSIPEYFKDVKLDEYILMPNHFHAIIMIEDPYSKGEASPDNTSGPMLDWSGDALPLQQIGTQSGSLGAIIQNFKSVSTRKVNRSYFQPGKKIWQRNYFERIVRNERELNAIRRYILDNPIHWGQDQANPENKLMK